MKSLTAFVEAATALGLSGAVAHSMGRPYVTVVAFAFVGCWLLLLGATHRRSEATEEPISFFDVVEITGAAGLFAVIWPAIPIILLVQEGKALNQR